LEDSTWEEMRTQDGEYKGGGARVEKDKSEEKITMNQKKDRGEDQGGERGEEGGEGQERRKWDKRGE